jgi:hypothetical protein
MFVLEKVEERFETKKCEEEVVGVYPDLKHVIGVINDTAKGSQVTWSSIDGETMAEFRSSFDSTTFIFRKI